MSITDNRNLPLREIGAHAPPLGNFYFLGVLATCTLTGFLTDVNGRMVGASFTKALNTASGSTDPQNFEAIYGKPVPPEAVGFVGQVSGQSAYVALIDPNLGEAASQVADFKANYARYPQIVVGPHTLGGVSGMFEQMSTLAGNSGGEIGTANILPILRPPVVSSPTMDTNAFSASDVLLDTTAIANATRAADEPAILEGVSFFDKDDNTAFPFELLILDTNTSVGTANAAPNISDANALKIKHRIPIPAADWYDVGGSKRVDVDLSKLPRHCWPATGTRTVYYALVNGAGTPTFTSAGLVAEFNFQDAKRGAA